MKCSFLRYSLLIIGFYFLIGCGENKIIILNGLDQDSANRVVVKLGADNIDAYRKEEKGGTFSISVAGKNRVAALTILDKNGLPRGVSTTLGEEFKKDSFISSPLEENARFIYALEAQISDMIKLIDGVSRASVQITLPNPEANILQNDDIKPSASILIKVKAGYHLEVYTTRIKQLVANSVPGLIASRVEVLFVSQTDY